MKIIYFFEPIYIIIDSQTEIKVPDLPDNIIIRELNQNDSIEELTDLLHHSYKILADMNLRYLASHQDVETTRHRIKNGICFIAELDRKLIGTITYYPPAKSKATELLQIFDAAWIGQMENDPKWQKIGLGTKLFKIVESKAQNNNISKIGLDTSEKASYLIKWYKKLGFRFQKYVSWEVTNYRSVVMIKKL